MGGSYWEGHWLEPPIVGGLRREGWHGEAWGDRRRDPCGWACPWEPRRVMTTSASASSSTAARGLWETNICARTQTQQNHPDLTVAATSVALDHNYCVPRELSCYVPPPHRSTDQMSK